MVPATVLAVGIVALLVSACSTGGGAVSPEATVAAPSTPAAATPSAAPIVSPDASPSEASPTGIALRTFPLWEGADCDAIGVDNPVIGELQGDLEDPQEPIWLRAPDGARLSIVWPAGFTVRFEPEATLYDELGRVVARAGDAVKLNQVSIAEATGTFEDPYYAAGILFEGCYPRQR